jgi:IclR family transcriptional regulator, acetate operon repressor
VLAGAAEVASSTLPTSIAPDPSHRPSIGSLWQTARVVATGKEQGEHRAGAQSVERALAILSLFRTGPAELGITEIARTTGLNLSTAHRIVRALCAAHFMEQDHETERYGLGPALFVLGQRALDGSGFSAAVPVLSRLATTTGESATLGIRRGNEIVVVLTSASQQRLRFEHQTGAGIGLHASAMGKSVLAFSAASPGEEVNQLCPLERYTAATITDPTRLIDELERVREQGYAVNHEERYEGVSAVGAPVLERSGVAGAAIGLQGPTARMQAGGFDHLGTEVRAAADEVAQLIYGTARTTV